LLAQSMRNRAGNYLQQPTGYRAFVPAPLPPDPAIDLGGPLSKVPGALCRTCSPRKHAWPNLKLFEETG
jgi:hypothetical protein